MRPINQLLGLVTLGALLVTWFVPTLGNSLFTTAEKFCVHLASRKSLSICLIVLAALLIRLSLLWASPVPVPRVHDEFSYLLAGDTFAHGRLTNPTHPMWIYLETFHVNQHPTYMSKYPPAQGAVLALGEVLGNPWIGVLLSMACMCAAILWALQGWLPPRWALLGGVLVLLHLGISGYWIDSYWGGAVAAIGGALVIGALPRILRYRRPLEAALLGIGVAMLANSRPFEGLVFCIPVFAVIAIWLCSRRSPSWGVTVPRIIIPISVVLALAAIFMGYYNWRGTGRPLLFPYTVNSRTYITNPELVWEKGRPPIHYLNPQFDAFYNGWQRETAAEGKISSIPDALRVAASHARMYASFFLWPELCIPLLAIPWILKDRRIRFLTLQFVICFAGFLLVVWFFPHYAAPLTATAFVLLVQAIRHLRKWSYRGRPIGIGFSRITVALALIFAPFHHFNYNLYPQIVSRARLTKRLASMPGDQLVIVRYTPQHDANEEWVYNGADIDHSHVVWARDIPGVSLQPLLDYFRDRHVWIVDADSPDPRLLPYVAPSGP